MKQASHGQDGPTFSQKFLAWLVHCLTASTTILGVLTLYFIHNEQFIYAIWCMGIAIFVDAIDGTLARAVNIKKVLPNIDGALLDNIADFLNYVITPCFFLLLKPDMLLTPWVWPVVCAICLSSSYQFTQSDAKTPDHFFKGFPSYWNIVVSYLYLFQSPASLTTPLLLILCVLVFVPIKYVYPSRLDYLTEVAWLKVLMLLASICFGIVSLVLLITYPKIPTLLVLYVVVYVCFYIAFSLLRTASPLIKAKLIKNETA